MKKLCINCEGYKSWHEVENHSSYEHQCKNCGEYALISYSNKDDYFLSCLHYLFSLPFLSYEQTNVQEWLDEKYPFLQRKNIAVLNLKNKNLEGELDLSDFINLESLDCSFNKLTKINLSSCSKLKLVDCEFNKLINLSLTNCLEITGLRCNDNYLRKLDLTSLNSEKLRFIDLRNNNLFVNYLSSFSQFINLETLWLGNTDERKLKDGIYNRFIGSLKPLQNLTKLKQLDISNLGINSNLEYLPDSIQMLLCFDTKYNEHNKKARKIIKKLSKFSIPKEKNSCDFSANLENWKNAHPRLMLKVEREKNQAAHQKIIDLETKNHRLLNEKNSWERQFPKQTPQQVNDEKNKLKRKYIDAYADLCKEEKYRQTVEKERDDLITKLDEEELQLQSKGYSENSRREIKNWNLLNRKGIQIPNLNFAERKGVVKILAFSDDDNGVPDRGYCDELIVFLVPFSSRLTLRDKINKSNLVEIESHLQIEYSQGIAEEIKQSSNKIIKSMIREFLQVWAGNKDLEWEWDVYVLVNKKTVGRYGKRCSFGHQNGVSADSAFYLALASTYLEVPLSDKIAITGSFELTLLEQNLELIDSSKRLEIERQIKILKETPISQWKIKGVEGIGFKVSAAVENGAKIIILSEENYEEYEREVPESIKGQIEKVVFVEKVADLNKFLLNRQQVHQQAQIVQTRAL